MESVCICGPSPWRIAGWNIVGRFMPSQTFRMTNAETGQVIEGLGARALMRYLHETGWPVETLDRRTWVWSVYQDLWGKMTKVASYPDPRPYPYPESARRRARDAGARSATASEQDSAPAK